MIPHWGALKLAGVAVMGLSPSVAQAQLDGPTIANVLRECRKIADATARVACYDNIPLGASAAVATSGSAAHPAPPAPAAPPAAASSRFGSNQLPRPASAETREADEIEAEVASVTTRAPGVYLLTLTDGTQWRFIDPAPSSYAPPRQGSMVTIQRAALGSYLLRHAGQPSTRIRRVR